MKNLINKLGILIDKYNLLFKYYLRSNIKNIILLSYNDISDSQKIAFWGAGKHTEELLKILPNKNKEIICILDKFSEAKGDFFCGYPVYSPKKIKDLGIEMIIISSYTYRKEIAEEIKIKYKECNFIDFYNFIEEQGLFLDTPFYFSPPELISKENINNNEFEDVYNILKTIENYFTKTNINNKKKIISYIKSLEIDDEPIYLFIRSFLLNIDETKDYVNDILEEDRLKKLSLGSKSFIYWQLIRKRFLNKNLFDKKNEVKLRNLYKEIFNNWRELLKIDSNIIPYEYRKSNRIVVFTNQFIKINHGPTRRVLDYCYTLKKQLGKEIFLINTADLPVIMNTPYYQPFLVDSSNGYSELNKIYYEGEKIKFYQCNKTMPNKEEINKIINLVLDYNPSFVFSVGHSNITADLCGLFTTVVTLPCSCELAITEGKFIVLARNIKKDDKEILCKMQISLDNVIEAEYTFKLPETNNHYNRGDFGLPEDKYILATVGTRLEKEITDNYSNKLITFLKRNPHTYIVFIGNFNNYTDFIAKSSVLEKQTSYIGYQKDILAIYKFCDGYLNPPREGGGSSAAQALSQGLPVFTEPFGDVSYAAGEYYHYNSFKEIEEFINKSTINSDFYEIQTKKAKLRSKQIIGSKDMLRKLINDIKIKEGKKGDK